MATPTSSARHGQVGPAAAFDSSPAVEASLAEWLRQAILTRSQALRLLRYRMELDQEPATARSDEQAMIAQDKRCLEALTAGYLLESERLFELSERLARS